MKIITIIMLAGCLQISAAGFSQNITITQQDAKIETIFKTIEKQTNFTFFYKSELLEHLPTISLDVKNAKLEQVLDNLFKKQPITYKIVDNVIVISAKGGDNVAPVTVSGTVKDKNGNPLPGATIMVKATKIAAVTDADGFFKIVADEQAVLVITSVGFKKTEINVNSQHQVNVILEEDVFQLNQVVVIGYGKQSREKVTDAISTVKGTDLNQYSGSSFAQQLAGKTAGVVINDASAQPGTDPIVVIRGIGTLTAGRAPLIVVDGFPLTEGSSFNAINPQDIESVDVLKDAASGAIYGSRAANGVILVTTKKGAGNKLKVSVDAYSGFQQRNDNLKYVDAYQAAVYFTEARDNAYVSVNPANNFISDNRPTRIAKGANLRELRFNYIQPYLDNQPGLTNTNWLNEVFRTAPMSSYNLSVSGSSGKTNYYISSNYFRQEGIVINNGLERYSGTIKLESKPISILTYGISLNPSYNKTRYFNNNANNSNDVVSDIAINYPFFTAQNPDGSLTISQQLAANTPEDGALAESAVALAQSIKNNKYEFSTFGNTYLILEPITGLKLKTVLGGYYFNNFYDYYNPSYVGGYRAPAPKPAAASENDGNTNNFITENTVEYSHSTGEHNFNLLGGYTFQEENGASTLITGSGIPDDNITNIAGASAFAVTANRYTWTQISYLARLQYSYADKYLFAATFREDGSSRFGTNNQWGRFPSVSGGYILSKEAFFPQNKVLTFAKLRASYGSAGNNQIGSYSSKGLIGSPSGTNNFNYVFGTTLYPGYAATSTPNNNLTWETKTSTDLGLDLGLFQKLNLIVDYYNSDTKNLLLNVPIPEQSGFSSSIQNVGEVNNKGFEFELAGNNFNLGKIKIGFNANFATNANKVLALAPGQTQIIQGASSNFVTKVGEPVAEMYGYQIQGVYKTQDQINNSPHLAGTLTGDYIVQDVNNDGVIDSRDQVPFGNFSPKFTFGFGGSLNYKNFELAFSFNGVGGRKIYDYGLATLDDSGEGFSMPSQYYFNNRYDPNDNPNGFLAEPNNGNLSSARRLTRASNIFYYNGDYLRLRNVQLAYNLPEALTSRVSISHIRLYATANNLYTWTQYRGYNPDATSTNVLTNGLANSNYPVARSFIFGVNVTF